MTATRFLVIGALLWVGAVNIAPLIEMARISLLDAYPTLPGHVAGYGIGNYATFLESPLYRDAFLRSMGFAAATAILTLIVVYPLAYHIAINVAPARRVRHLLLLAAPFWTSEIVRIFAITLLLSHRGGANILLRWIGLADAPLPLLYNRFSVGFGMVYAMLLVMLLPLYAALDKLPRSLLDAASDLGSGPWTRLWRIVLPLTRGGIVSGCVLVFLLATGAFAVPMLLGGADTTLFSLTIGGFFSNAEGQWPMGAAFSIIMLVAASAVAGGVFALAARR
ncbi:MAG: ABC transporter permease [Acetobacteraceae bacterium]